MAGIICQALYSGMEYGYYHGFVATDFAPALAVDVLYPGCLADSTDEVGPPPCTVHRDTNSSVR